MAAGSKRVRLYIDSDATGVQKGVGQAQRSLKGFEAQSKKTQSVMGGLRSTAGGLGLAFGAAGLAIGINESLTAFKDQEKQMARVIATLKTLGVNTDAMRKKVLAVTDAQSKLSGFQDDELQASFSTILRVSKDTEQSFKLNALAMDIARGSGKNLQVVALAIAKAVDGNANALVRYGVKAQKGASVTDVLTLAQKRYAGQAEEFGKSAAGSAAKADVAIDQLKQSVGGKLAPAMNAAAGATIKLAGATGSLIDHAGGIGPVVSGAAGFGAFKLLGPSMVNAGSALGSLGKVAGNKGAGASFRVLGSAIGSSITPMGAAAVGAGLLAGGIYELWHTSESADQAVQGLNSTIKGLTSALDQKTAAKDAVKAAQDYVKATKDAEHAARSRASALHADLVQLEAHKHTEAQTEAATKKWKKALDDVVPAVHAHQRATHDLGTAQRNLQTSIDGVNVASGEQNRKARDVTDKVIAQTTEVKVAGKSAVLLARSHASAAEQAEHFAGLMDKAAAATKRSDRAVSTADSNLAGFARHIGRIPTIREIKLVTKYTAEGMSLDELTRKIDHLRSKKITLTTQVNAVTGDRSTPSAGNAGKVTPKPKITFGSATGAFVAGNYAAGDRVPAMLSGEEAVLNPRHIAMVDSGWSVMDALRATNAPVIGMAGGGTMGPGHRGTRGRQREGTFRPDALLYPGDARDVRDERGMARPMIRVHFEDQAPGEYSWVIDPRAGGLKLKKGYSLSPESPAGFSRHTKGGKPQSGGGRVFVSGKAKTPPTKAELISAALDRRGNVWSLAESKSALRIAQAEAAAQANTAGDPIGMAVAYEADAASETGIISAIQKILANPAKALGVKGATLNRQQRASLLQALASAISQRTGDLKTAFDFRHPEATSGDAGSVDGSGEGAAAGDTGPTPDQQALLDQKQRQIDVLTRSGSLSEAALRGFGSSGDIGTGNFANAFDAARGGPQIAMLGDARSLQAFAAGATAGMGMQPSISANAGSVNV